MSVPPTDGVLAYACTATLTTWHQDTRCHLYPTRQTVAIGPCGKDDLYEEIARLRIKYTRVEGEQDPDDPMDSHSRIQPWDAMSISFGPVMAIMAMAPVDESILQSTQCWKDHQSLLAEQEARRKARLDREEADLAERDERYRRIQEREEMEAYHRVSARLAGQMSGQGPDQAAGQAAGREQA